MILVDRPSPNHAARPEGTVVDILVLHYTELPLKESLDILSDDRREARVSAHYVLAVIAFATVTIAAFIGAGPLRFAGHDGLGMASTLLGIVMAIGCAGVIVLARISRPSVFGLFERLIYVGFLAWFLVLGVGAIAG